MDEGKRVVVCPPLHMPSDVCFSSVAKAGGECHGFVFRLLHLLCKYLAAVATTVIVTLTVILDENFSNCIGQFCFMAD